MEILWFLDSGKGQKRALLRPKQLKSHLETNLQRNWRFLSYITHITIKWEELILLINMLVQMEVNNESKGVLGKP
jgi:hypothetical protein